jgi:2-iminobutanoate/2-iminopropanoate deaminase
MNTSRLMIAAIFAALVLIGLTVSAFTQKQKTSDASRRYLNLPGRTATAPFSDGVMTGNTLYLAGRLGLDPKTGKPPEDVEQEIRLLLDGIKSVLSEAGMTMDDLVQVQIFCPDLTLYDKFNAVYKTYFTGQMPARAFIGSGSLLRGARFEVMGVAVKR